MSRRRPLFALWTAVLLLGLASHAGAQVLYWVDTSFGAPTLNRADDNGVALSSVPLAFGTLPEGLALDAAGKLYYGEAKWTGARVNRVSPTLASITPIVTGGSMVRGVAVDPNAQRVYWTTSNLSTGATIGRSNLDGSGAVTLLSLGAAANPRQIAVDVVGGRIYWTDIDQNKIFFANLDGTGMSEWLTLPAGSRPYGIAVDAVSQLVYWTEWGSGLLKRATVASPSPTAYHFGLINPSHLTLDVAGGRLFWAEGGAFTQRIRRGFTNGTGLVTLPCPLTTYGGLVYQGNGAVSSPAPTLPAEFALERPRPNPGHGPIQVRFALPRESSVRLSVLDVQGREIALLADGVMPAGTHDQVWGVRAGDAAGVYFVRLVADGRIWTERVVRTR